MTKLSILNTPKRNILRKTRRFKSKAKNSEIYVSSNEGITVMKNIPPIIWTSLNVYPEINNVFNNLDIKYVKKSTRTIVSDMGIIKVLEYARTIRSPINDDIFEYTTHGIAKYSPGKNSDNLFYEYLVGIYCINNLTKKFPIFILTHGIYTLSNILRKRFVKKEQIYGQDLYTGFIPFNITDYSLACISQYKLCITLQYCHGLINLSHIQKIPYYDIELCMALFQIYYTLSQCKHIFTHYDLHDDNCGIMILPNNACMIYEYHLTDEYGHSKIIRFCSRFIVKIFDYGRSYFLGNLPNGSSISSKMVYKTVSDTQSCRPPNAHGFIKDPEIYINQSIPNASHDLRLIHLLKDICLKIPALAQLATDLVYKDYYGTPSIKSSQSKCIKTVDDACIRLGNIISIISPETGISISETSFNIYKEYHSLGTLHVLGIQYDMHFQPNIKYKE